MAEIAIALGTPRWPVVRQVAVSVATRAILEMNRHGRFPAAETLLSRVSRRWRLGSFCDAMQSHYPY